jgi:hypothetical protein
MKKINDKISLIVVLLIAIMTLSVVGVTYSKFLFQQDISNTINVPEYNHCLANGYDTLSECIIANENDVQSPADSKTTLKAKTTSFDVTATNDEGLYMAEDDFGESYYYRGTVVDNYVEFAGYIWRIVRVNGDGSVRLVYSGTSTLDAGEATTIGTTKYNSSEITDMTLLGYKYGLNQSLKTTESAIYNDLYAEKTSVHSNERSCSSSTKLCTLSGNNVITEQWSTGYKSVLHFTWTDIMSYFRKPKYTCWKPSTDSICNITMEVTGRTDGTSDIGMATEVKGTYYGYISNSYSDTLTNNNDSTIKAILDTWYLENLVNQTDTTGTSFADYIADNKFCNDRSLSSGDGNTLSADSVYSSYNRNTNNKTPSLKCTQTQDSFSTTSEKGNATLTYPIGLLTADELALSGAVAGTENAGSYLNTGISYWTMSPGYFSVTKLTENNYIMNSTGTLTTESIKNESGIRPVINLSNTVKITSGNGTSANPYQVTLN